MEIKQTEKGISYIEDNGVIVSKKCTNCNEMKSLEEFHNGKAAFAGKKAMCKVCACTYSRERKAERAERKRNEAKKGIATTWEGNTEAFRLVKPYGNIKTEHIVKAGSDEIVAKTCSGCAEMLELSKFHESKTCLGDKTSQCKVCNDKRLKKWVEDNPEKRMAATKRWVEDNPEKIKAKRDKWYEEKYPQYRADNIEMIKEKDRLRYHRDKEKRQIYHRKWREENPEYIYKYQINYYAENTEQKKDYQKQYYQENKEKVYHHGRIRRTRMAALPSTLTLEQDRIILEIQDYSCLLSGATENLHLEHFIPVAWGAGGTTFENCYYMEGTLNMSKGRKNPFEWIKYQPEEYQDNFNNKLVPELAARNNMTIEEFTDYVYQCEQNAKELA